MIKRIIQIREQEGLSQEKFANRLGLSRNFINQAENGKKNFSDRTISDICREFNINEKWLHTGDGNMYNLIEDETAALVSDLLEDGDQDPFYHLILSTIKLYQSYDEKGKEIFKSFARSLADEMRKSDD